MNNHTTNVLTPASAPGIAWPRLNMRWLLLATLLAGVMVLFLMELTMGTVRIPLPDVVAILFGREVADASWSNIVLRFRLPKALTAMCAGAAFAAAGLQMQTMFRNPLAGPWILGVTAGAKLGVGIIVVAAGAAGSKFIASPMLGVIGNLGMAGGACLGAALVFGAILFLSRRVSAVTLLIVGLMFGFLADGLLDFILYFSTYAHYQMFHAWTHESFSGLTWNQIRALVAVTLAGLAVALLSVKALNALLLGERYAHSMGESVGRARFLCMAGTVGMSATVTAFCGPIMFLDLAVPHLCRGLFNTSDHRTLMPGVILMGAALALAGDVIINQPGMYKALHVNAINTMIGVPVVLWIIFRRKQMRALEL